MDLTISMRHNGIKLLKLADRMDIEGTGQIDLKLNAATAEDEAFLVADLSDVDFMSSIGIGALVRVAKAARRRRGNLVLLNPQPIVRLVLEKTGVSSLMTIHETLDAASSAVRSEVEKPS